jgi:hypothetical protein
MVNGVPTARSQRYKAAQKLLQEQTKSTPIFSGNDVFPSPTILLDQPTTQAEGAQRAFVTVRVLHQAMLHTVTPGTHLSDLLQLMGPYLSDCSEWYREAQDRISALQTQLDETNSKLTSQFEAQNVQILKLQDELKVNIVRQEFYRQQAEKGQMVPPHRRRRHVSADSDNSLTPDQLYQQVLLNRDDITHRDSEIARLQELNLAYEAMIDQILNSTSACLDRHEALSTHHLALIAQQQICDSALAHYRRELLECQAVAEQQVHDSAANAARMDAQLHLVDAQLQETLLKYNKLDALATTEDQLLRVLVDHERIYYNPIPPHRLRTLFDQLVESRPYLQRSHF